MFPTAISIWIGALALGNYTMTTTGFDRATKYRAQIQVLVDVVKSILILPWTYAFCTTFNHWTRTIFWKKPKKLHTIKLWAAVSQGKTAWGGPWWYLLIGTGVCAFVTVPGYSWTGALTLVLTTIRGSGNITVMAQNISFWPYMDRNVSQSTHCRTIQGAEWYGTCPGFHQSSSLLQSAGSAINVDGIPRNHSKLDESGYKYHGRSYGVGLAAGLDPNAMPSSDRIQGFSHFDSGYATDAICRYNASSLWTISYSVTNHPQYLPNIFNALGWFPASNITGVPAEHLNRTWLKQPKNQLYGKHHSGWYSQTASGSNARRFSIGAAPPGRKIGDPFHVLLAAGSFYHRFDTIQCELHFKPSRFNVSVSTLDRTITVSPKEAIEEVDVEESLRRSVMGNLENLCKQETTMYDSAVGNAFRNSFNVLLQNQSALPDFDSAQANRILPLRAVEASLLAMVDDILASNALYGIMTRNGTATAETRLVRAAYRIGSPGWVIAIFVVHIVAFFFILAVSLYTKFWHKTMLFDYADPISLALSTLVGTEERGCTGASHLKNWNRDPWHSSLKKVQCTPSPEQKIGSLALEMTTRYQAVSHLLDASPRRGRRPECGI